MDHLPSLTTGLHLDLRHIKRVARGVPEDQWDPLLEQITRVMKPGGAFEVSNIHLPGQAMKKIKFEIKSPR
jgi:hypothetical protein